MEESLNENADRDRIVYDYKHSIIQSVEHDNNGPSTWTCAEARDSNVLREQYSERGRQLDENESVCKEQYDSNHCEDVTGLSSDGYRHQVIEEYTHEQMADNAEAESQGADYWDASSKDASMSSGSQNAVQSENADYWAAGNSGICQSDDPGKETERSHAHENECSV